MRRFDVRPLFLVVPLTLAFFLLHSFLSLQPATAQSAEIFVNKQLGRSNATVGVGEYLTFTIYIENRTNFTVTVLPLTDVFNNDVLGYADAMPPPDTIDLTAGQLDWTDLTTTFGDLGVGEGVTVVVGFIAEHPAPAVVNRAEVNDAVNGEGEIPSSGDDSDEGEAVGGAAPVDKDLLDGIVPEVGLPLTFTIQITNDGFTTMTVVPLLEDYEPEYLRFLSAVPQPDTVDEVAGELRWSDLTNWFGDLSAQEAITVLVVFEALAPIDVTSNRASTAGGRDWYENDLDAGEDQVPIRIVTGQEPTLTPTPTATAPAATATPSGGGGGDDGDGGGGNEQQPTPTPFPTVTPTPDIPETLPDTGIPPAAPMSINIWLVVLAFLLPVGLWVGWQKL